MTFTDYCRTVILSRNKDERTGQTCFNVLHAVRPDLAEQVRNRVLLDPFYDDSRVPVFLDFVQQQWDQNPEEKP